MKLASLEHYGIDPKRLMVVSLLVGLAAAVSFAYASGGILGAGSPELAGVIAALVAYLVFSAPRHLLDSSSFAQSREAPTLAAMASAHLEATHSRPRTVLMLRASDKGVSEVLTEIGRSVLLGRPLESSTEASIRSLGSYSVANVLRKLVTASPGSVRESDEENQGMWRALLLAEESKIPLFTTVCFFTPIMLLLYVLFSRLGDIKSLVEIITVQFFLLDLAYYFSSQERGRLG